MGNILLLSFPEYHFFDYKENSLIVSVANRYSFVMIFKCSAWLLLANFGVKVSLLSARCLKNPMLHYAYSYPKSETVMKIKVYILDSCFV